MFYVAAEALRVSTALVLSLTTEPTYERAFHSCDTSTVVSQRRTTKAQKEYYAKPYCL